MAKRNVEQTKEANTVNSRSAKKVEHEKAIMVLEKAKLIPRKVVFLKQGEGEYSRKLQKPELNGDVLNSKDAAEYIGISYNLFSRRHSKTRLPSIKKGSVKFFKISDLDKYKNQIINAKQHN